MKKLTLIIFLSIQMNFTFAQDSTHFKVEINYNNFFTSYHSKYNDELTGIFQYNGTTENEYNYIYPSVFFYYKIFKKVHLGCGINYFSTYNYNYSESKILTPQYTLWYKTKKELTDYVFFPINVQFTIINFKKTNFINLMFGAYFTIYKYYYYKYFEYDGSYQLIKDNEYAEKNYLFSPNLKKYYLIQLEYQKLISKHFYFSIQPSYLLMHNYYSSRFSIGIGIGYH